MGLKSLLLFNKNSITSYFNYSYLNYSKTNRFFYLFIFIKNLFYNYFNSYFFFSFFSNLRKNKIKKKNEFIGKLIIFGKINYFIYKK